MGTEIDEAFGRRARDLREQARLSQLRVAELMSTLGGSVWHQTTVAKTESGSRPIKLNEAVTLAAVFGTELAELLSLSDPTVIDVGEMQRVAALAEVERMRAFLVRRWTELA